MKLINKDALVAEIERVKCEEIKWMEKQGYTEYHQGLRDAYRTILSFISTLEVKDPYEQSIQYSSVKDAIQAHAETYSFNIESELFHQLTKEQQALWRKEIEQAVISGGQAGVELARDPRYEENAEVKEVDLENIAAAEWDNYVRKMDGEPDNSYMLIMRSQYINLAKHFFELGLSVNNPITAADRGTAEEIIINLKRVEQDYRIGLTKEMKG